MDIICGNTADITRFAQSKSDIITFGTMPNALAAILRIREPEFDCDDRAGRDL